jgi:hypothetical protein
MIRTRGCRCRHRHGDERSECDGVQHRFVYAFHPTCLLLFSPRLASLIIRKQRSCQNFLFSDPKKSVAF